jgi:hypothetical protein
MALGEEQLGAPGIWRLIVVLSVAGLILVSISHRHRDVDDDDDDDDDEKRFIIQGACLYVGVSDVRP